MNTALAPNNEQSNLQRARQGDAMPWVSFGATQWIGHQHL